jgi:hypothetical protein
MLNSMLRPGILQVAALGNVMSFRAIAMIYTAGTALALATPAAAGDLSADGASYAPVYAPANDMPSAAVPDIRPEWRGGPTNVALLPDSRTRDAWLHECRQRTAYYYDNGGHYRHYRRHDRDWAPDYGYAPGYDYCEAYFDDYYRTYTQPGYAYAYPAMVGMRPVAVAQSYQTNAPRVEEVVTEHYESIRSRTIPSRRIRPAMHDKRVRVSP